MIIFLYGDDTFRSRQKLKEMKDKFLREVDPSGNSIVTLDGDNATVEKINELAAASSLFSRKRMIIVERIISGKNKTMTDQIYLYLKDNFGADAKKKNVPENENIIVIWEDAIDEKNIKSKLFDFLSKEKFAYSFKVLSGTDTVAWIKKEVESRGAKIKPQAASMLTVLFGSNLWQINNEIDKLISFKQGKTLAGVGSEVVIDENDVSRLARGNFDENIFALTDAISNRNKALAAALFEKEIEAGITEINLLFMIVRQFRIMLLVRQCLDKSYTSKKITSQLRLHPFVVQKSLTQVRNFTSPTLKKILTHLIDIDKGVKTGQVEAKLAMSVLLAKI